MTDKGWCKSPLDAAPGVVVNNQHECFDQCKSQKDAVAADYFKRDGVSVCFCQSECPCLMASLAGGGDGLLAIEDTLTPSKNMCYKMKAGIGAQGWCPGNDVAPTDTTATTANQCYEKCKAEHSGTVAVDFWDVTHPLRTAANVCWCQDKCDCTLPSKSDMGDGILFVFEGTNKGDSCGVNMKTVVEGNDNSHCEGAMTNPTADTLNPFACQQNCKTDGKGVATWVDGACKCQDETMCSCMKAGKGFGFRFMPETMHTPHMCESQMVCDKMKDAYKLNGCCGNPAKIAKIR